MAERKRGRPAPGRRRKPERPGRAVPAELRTVTVELPFEDHGKLRLSLLEHRSRLEFTGLETLAPPRETELVDLAQSSERADHQLKLAERDRRTRHAIDMALGRMGSGSFGICEECEQPIPARRLLAIPEARLCAPCQALDERENERRRQRRA